MVGKPGEVPGTKRKITMSNVATDRTEITLDNVKISVQQSRGSTCFTALVYFEGSLVGSADCQGRGDGIAFRPHAALNKGGKWKPLEVDAVKRGQAEAYAIANPVPGGMEGALEDHIGLALDWYRSGTELKRRLKSKCIVVSEGKAFSYTGALSANAETRATELCRYTEIARKSDPEAKILNVMPWDEAHALYHRATSPV